MTEYILKMGNFKLNHVEVRWVGVMCRVAMAGCSDRCRPALAHRGGGKGWLCLLLLQTFVILVCGVVVDGERYLQIGRDISVPS